MRMNAKRSKVIEKVSKKVQNAPTVLIRPG